jgi:Mg-chelatase subunit ChlD/streptogramin lyase
MALGMVLADFPGPSAPAIDMNAAAAVEAAPAAEEGPLRYRLDASWPLPARGFEPVDLALAPDGRLFVADQHRQRIEIFDADGAYIGRWPAPLRPGYDRPLYPHRLAVDPSGRRVFIVWSAQAGGGDMFLEVRQPDGVVVHAPRWLKMDVKDIDATDPDQLWLLSEGSLIQIQASDLRKLSEHDAGSAALNSARRMAMHPDGGASLLLVVGESTYVSRYNAQASLSATQVYTDDLALDLTSAPDGSLRVLFGPPEDAADPEDPARVVLRDFAPDGSPGRVWTRAELPDLHSPYRNGNVNLQNWAIDRTAQGFAASTAMRAAPRDFRVLRYDAAGKLLQAQDSWLGIDKDAAREKLPGEWAVPASALGWSAAGLQLLDGRGRAAELQRFRSDGRVDILSAGLEPSSGDLAVVPDGSSYFSAPEDGLWRVAADGSNPRALGSACDCEFGGRLAIGRGASAGMLFVSRPFSSTVGLIDLGLDAELTRFRLPDAAGLWPADLAILPEGDLLTADTASGEVQRWRPDGSFTPAWQERPGSGILRLATARLADGRDLAVALRASGEIRLEDLSGGLLASFDPLSAPGVTGPIEDVALDSAGRIYLSDVGAEAVQVFVPEGMIPLPPPFPTARPTDSASCRVDFDKVAGPPRIVLGETAQVTLTLKANCYREGEYKGADVVMALERHIDSDGTRLCFRFTPPPVDLLGAEVAGRVLRRFDLRHHRVGLLSQTDTSLFQLPLGSELSELLPALAFLGQSLRGHHRFDALISEADRMLLEEGRPDALPVLVLITTACSDIRPNAATDAALERARAMRSRGVLIFVVHVAGDILPSAGALLKEVAGSPERYVIAESAMDGDRIAIEINRLITELAGRSLAGNLLIHDQMSTDVQLMPGSARPVGVEGSDWLSWRRGLLPATGLTMTYTVLPLRTGILPTNRLAEARFIDADGSPRNLIFPVPEIEVVAPSPTPSPTTTPTTRPSPTPLIPPTAEPVPVYLPILFRQACLRDRRRLDVVLVADSSQSMLQLTRDGRSKLLAARSAMGDFLTLLDMPPDRAALIGFDAEARLLQRMTDDRTALSAALESLQSRSGTRIDLGLEAGHAEFLRARGATDRQPVMILLTDGQVDPAQVPAVEAAAARIRADGMRLLTIGLGQDVDAALLQRIAASPADFLNAPDGEDLVGIYRRLAAQIACGN